MSIDLDPRPSFSRFERNYYAGASLPIYPLAYPAGDMKGIVLVGDYVAQDFVKRAMIVNPDFRKRWVICATTQSDAVPVDCVDVDFNFFTNRSGVGRYLTSEAGSVPFANDLGDGHYVDPDIFTPDFNTQKEWDLVYPAKWYPTKRTELIIEAAILDPSHRFAIYGWPVLSERKVEESRSYRDYIVNLARGLHNLDVFDSGFDGEIVHQNDDGSFVVGGLSKLEMRDLFFRRARASVFLSETTEAINRVCTEMLCCDVPMLVAPTSGGLDLLIKKETGLMISRTGQGIVDGLNQAIADYNVFSPRAKFLENYGKNKANKRLQDYIKEIEVKRGICCNWEGIRKYGGDLWTTPEIYKTVK